jgi:hypothetical protein
MHANTQNVYGASLRSHGHAAASAAGKKRNAKITGLFEIAGTNIMATATSTRPDGQGQYALIAAEREIRVLRATTFVPNDEVERRGVAPRSNEAD